MNELTGLLQTYKKKPTTMKIKPSIMRKKSKPKGVKKEIDDKEIVGRATILKDAIHKYREKKIKKRTRPVRKASEFKYFAASACGYQARVLYLMSLNLTGPPDVLGLTRMENGDYVHERLQTEMEEAGLQTSSEKQVSIDNPPMKGRLDSIIDIDGILYVGEIKSINANGYRSIRKDGPKQEHLEQLVLYMYALEMKEGWLIYECKDNQGDLYFLVTLDDEGNVISESSEGGRYESKKLLDKIFKKMNYVLKCIKSGQIPTKCSPCTISRCYYSSACERASIGKVVMPNV